MVLPKKFARKVSKNGGCHNWENSIKEVTTKTPADILTGFVRGKMKNTTKIQKTTYKNPPK